jgi:acetyltransferase
VLSQNTKMLRLCKKLGFRAIHNRDDHEVVMVRRHL